MFRTNSLKTNLHFQIRAALPFYPILQTQILLVPDNYFKYNSFPLDLPSYTFILIGENAPNYLRTWYWYWSADLEHGIELSKNMPLTDNELGNFHLFEFVV